CESLEEALRQFEGTVLVVSHDRYFLNRVVDMLIVFENDGRVRVIAGNYDTYQMLRASVGETGNRQQAIGNREGNKRQAEDKRAEGKRGKRKRKFPYRKVAEIEAEIASLEEQLRHLEQELASPDLYRDGDKVKQTTQAFEETKAKLPPLYEHWEEAVEL